MGKLQLNTKELKDFRDTLAKWHIADFKLADELLRKQKNIKNTQSLIDDDKLAIEEIANGTRKSTRTIEQYENEITEYEQKIKDYKAEYDKLKDEHSKAIADGRALITDELLKAITEYMSDIYSDDAENTVIDALIKWFTDLGAKNVDADGVRPYLRALGVKKASAKTKCKTSKHNTTQSKIATQDIFLGALADEPTLNALLPIYKWTTVIEKKTKKN